MSETSLYGTLPLLRPSPWPQLPFWKRLLDAFMLIIVENLDRLLSDLHIVDLSFVSWTRTTQTYCVDPDSGQDESWTWTNPQREKLELNGIVPQMCSTIGGLTGFLEFL
ncbi:hypothetical protein GSI_07810 [Ganoderma sinense ZZ0214-1]|uniref:Uncharacterized protein n=1 Tax=Ganoderma sinense ZZ0214-1 TaxID=1077348 RepID=A0A2G8S7Z5_9APHY|nr:hypothetical protein GSI_07810 [Ganoderma sinense ZZ0214-1]